MNIQKTYEDQVKTLPILAQSVILSDERENNESATMAKIPQNIQTVPQYSEPKANALYIKLMKALRGPELTDKADQFGIPYNKSNIDWLQLRDDVEEYEELIERADALYINWQSLGYDPVGLEQEIVDTQYESYRETQDFQLAFLNSVRVGV